MSTFALDVDTGSFSVARTLLDSGLLPPAESIRPEEWVNAFDYHQQAPTHSDLGVEVESALAPSADDGTQVVRIGIKAREISAAQRPPVALTMVVDTSGSMDIRERLGLVKSSLALLAEHLRPTDTIAIVTYEDNARPVLPPTPIRETGAIVDAIEDLRPGGSTNLAAGLRLGYQQARAAHRPDAVNAVILASDGVANVGMTGPDALSRMIARGGDEGIHLVTVGFGMGNYNDDLMEQLADQGDGFYAYVDSFSEAERLFVDELSSTLTPVAMDAKVQVEF
ncbi:MAG: von Willebrand factor type A domain-containing protein, partial [Actinomycetota bacterium]|nr:von Willebrand factor type A domain-containing protein [Actinomycetota bacterium]